MYVCTLIYTIHVQCMYTWLNHSPRLVVCTYTHVHMYTCTHVHDVADVYFIQFEPIDAILESEV